MSTKQELLNSAAREYKAFHETIQGLNEEQMTEVWLGTWSVRDIVAHMSGWHRELGPALERLARGERPVPGSTAPIPCVPADERPGTSWNKRTGLGKPTGCVRSSRVSTVLLKKGVRSHFRTSRSTKTRKSGNDS